MGLFLQILRPSSRIIFTLVRDLVLPIILTTSYFGGYPTREALLVYQSLEVSNRVIQDQLLIHFSPFNATSRLADEGALNGKDLCKERTTMFLT